MKERKVSLNNIPNMYKYHYWFQNSSPVSVCAVKWGMGIGEYKLDLVNVYVYVCIFYTKSDD